MKKFLISILAALLLVVNVNAEEKVHVYMFEAGECPYCEAQEEYLKGLEGYGTTFDLIKKELYVDHVDWKKGKDYELGKKVAEVFMDAGFEDASYEGTPFVVISDVYAAAAYSEDLESYINMAATEGDKDAVKCIGEGKDNCVRVNDNSISPSKEEKTLNKKTGIVLAIVGGVLLIGAIVYVVKNTKTEEETEEKPAVKKTTKKTKK